MHIGKEGGGGGELLLGTRPVTLLVCGDKHRQGHQANLRTLKVKVNPRCTASVAEHLPPQTAGCPRCRARGRIQIRGSPPISRR